MRILCNLLFLAFISVSFNFYDTISLISYKRFNADHITEVTTSDGDHGHALVIDPLRDQGKTLKKKFQIRVQCIHPANRVLHLKSVGRRDKSKNDSIL